MPEASPIETRPSKGASIYDVRNGRGRGSPKSRQKEQNQLISVCFKGGGVKKSPKIADVIYGSPRMRELACTVRGEERKSMSGPFWDGGKGEAAELGEAAREGESSG